MSKGIKGFKKGYTPWNKGIHGVTSNVFKKGHIKSPLSGIKKGQKKGLMPEYIRQKISETKTGVKQSLEIIENRKKSMPRGENHYNWIFDRTKLVKKQERNDSSYREWRKQVWVRDNYKCKISNKNCKGRIEAHHILGWEEFPELRYEINNGITLCHAHHPKRRAEEKRLICDFQGLVSVSKV